MNQVKVTWMRAFKVYWSLLWRTALYTGLPCAAILLIVYGVPIEAIADPEAMEAMIESASPAVGLLLIGVLIAIVLSTWIVKTVLCQAYSDFRIVLEGPPQRLRIEPRL